MEADAVAGGAAGSVGGGGHEQAMSKVRFSLVCIVVGFFAAYAMGFRDNPTGVFDWIVFLVGSYLFGALVLVAAAAALTLAGCVVCWPGQALTDSPRHASMENDQNERLMRATLTPTRRHLGWAAMIGGLAIGQSIPLVVGYFVGGVWTFLALVPMMVVMGLG